MSGNPRGFGFPFRVEPGSGGVAWAHGPEKIRDNLVQILLTAAGERTMRRDYGAGVGELVHDPMNDALFAVTQHRIGQAIARWEPRVHLTDVRVRSDRRDGGDGPGTLGGNLPGAALIAEVEFVIRSTGQPVTLSVPLGSDGAGASGGGGT